MTQKDNKDKPEWLFRVWNGTDYTEYIFECGLSYPITKKVIPDTVKSNSEDGYVTTRPRFTRRRFTFELSMPFVKRADVDKMLELDLEVTGSKTFEWYNEIDDYIYTVRFVEDSRPEYTDDHFSYTTINFSLEEF